VGDRLSRRVWGNFVAILALVVTLVVALGGGSASASSLSPEGDRATDAATRASAVVTGSYAGRLDDASAAVAVIAKAPAADGQPRTISMYVCNGTSLAAWLTGKTTGNSATLRSADGRYAAQVSVTPRRAGGVLSIPGGSPHRFVAPSAVPTSGLFDVTIGRTGVVQGRSTTGATLSGRIGTTGTLPAKGTVAATASAGGTKANLTALGSHLTPGAYRWIVLADGKVHGANKQGPGSGGVAFTRLTGKKVSRKVSAGSAGVPGWNNARCQGLANKWSNLVDSASKDIASGNDASADAKLTKAQGMLNTLESKCLTTGLG
jgi:hypothetical protein